MEDGFLTIREIYDLRLDAELVVLSACSSAGGKPIRGEGMIALARPFLVAGANPVIHLYYPLGQGIGSPGALYRNAFYEPGSSDGAGRDHPRPSNR